MKKKHLKIQFLSPAPAKVWLFLDCGHGRFIAVPDDRDQRAAKPELPVPAPALRSSSAASARRFQPRHD